MSSPQFSANSAWANKIAKILNLYIPHPEISLLHKDPYTLLIATLLSAQCTDARVNLVTPELFALADTPKKMVQLTQDEIAAIIRPCGFFSVKAKAIWNLSKQLLERYKGQVPDTLEDLETLPGVGHKTASVVISQAFHKPAFPVDTHIHRCAKRWHLSQGTTVVQTENDLKALFPKTQWNQLHLQIILFARKYCPARGHQKEMCPICKMIPTKSPIT